MSGKERRKRVDATLIVLAGGQSRRMGHPKPHLLINGKRLLDIVIDKLGDLFSDVIIVTKENFSSCLSYKVVRDLHPVSSPLVGIYTGLFHSGTENNFVVACDMPFVKPELVNYMIKVKENEDSDIVVPVVRGFYEPLCTVYSKRIVPVIEEQIKKQVFKVTSFYRFCKLREVSESEIRKFDPDFLSFINLNTPKDLEKYRYLFESAQ